MPMMADDEVPTPGGSEEDEERTVFGSAPVSRFSTVRGKSGLMRRRPWGLKFGGDKENALGMDSSFTKLIHRGSTVSFAFFKFIWRP